MTNERILIAEDDGIIAARLQSTLTELGYAVPEIVASGEEAVRRAAETRPELVLMDTRLAGAMDGLEAGGQIRARLDIPVIYLAAHLDETLLQRALPTEPYGFLVKPVQDRELHAAVELAIYRHRADRQLRESEARYRLIVESTGDVIWTLNYKTGKFTYVSPSVQKLRGYTPDEVLNQTMADALTPESLAAATARMQEGIAERKPGDTSLAITKSLVDQPRKDGSVVSTEVVSTTVFDEQGYPVEIIGISRDITERKRAEEALIESEKRYRTVVETMPNSLTVSDSTGRVTFANQRSAELHGYASAHDLQGMHVLDLAAPDSGHLLYEARELARKGNIVRDMELRLRRRDGTEYPGEISIAMIPDAKGQPAVFVGIMRDITERKQAEEALRESEGRLSSFMNSASDSFYLLDSALNFVEINDRGLAIIGKSKEEVIGKNIADIVPDVKASGRYEKHLEVIRTGQAFEVEDFVPHPVFGDLQFVLKSFKVGDGLGVIASDITERKRAEEARARLATAIDQAAESIVITDTAGIIQYVNPAFERITGYSPAEAIGQNPRILKSGKQDAAFYEALWATITAGQVWQGRLVNKKKDGTLYTEEATISPVRDEDGAIVSYVAVKRDVTRELQLEEQYRQAQKMEAVGRLTAGVAHDFNNMLTAINGFSELMSLELAPDHPLQESIKKVLGSGQRAAGLVRQLMAFSRKQIVQPEVLDLNAVLANVDKMLRRIIGEDIALQTIPAPGLWPTRADPVQVEQVILNLAVNARDAMPDGGKLTIETANVTLDEAYAAGHLEAQPGKYVLLAIGDTGIGMNEEVKSHLFEPFYTTKELGRGTGLGLATVYGIVKQSGGDIQVHSEADVGTTFKVYLPRAGQATPPAAPSPAGPDMPAGRETVLLVEDNEGARELARRVLRSVGYMLLEARDGQDALRLAADYPGSIHLLLTDVVLPGMSGKALAEQLARSYPGLKTLFMSGYTDNAIAHHGVLEPGIAFLQKPFGPMELARKVRAVLDTPPQSND